MPTYVQENFRFGNDDGSESTATFSAAQNTNITPTITTDTNLTLRIEIANTTGGAIGTIGWQLQVSRNSGTYKNVDASTSSFVRGFNSANLADDDPTTNRITGGTGTFIAGLCAEDGLADSFGSGYGLSASKYTEFLFMLTLVFTDLVNGDTLDFQIANLNTYTVTPRITVTKTGGTPTGARTLGLLGAGI